MTSGNDDLEQQLRENQLRCELASEGAKTKQGGRIAYRLGWVLYWTCLVIAAVWGLLLPVIDNFELVSNFPRDPWGSLAVVGIPALLLYGLSRAFRYVLSRK
jgi:hypothetical protein